MSNLRNLFRRQTNTPAYPMAHILGAVALVAGAAGLPTGVLAQAAAPTDPTPATDLWSGGYLGATAGYAWSNRDARVTTSDPQGSLIDPSGLTQAVLLPTRLSASHSDATAGIEAGYNHVVVQHVLLGAEADVSFGGKTANGAFASTFNDPQQPIPAYTSLSALQTRLNWLSTARVRVGYATGRVLAFATAGLALGRVHSEAVLAISNTGNPPSDTYTGGRTQTRAGYVIGGGGEYAVSRALSFKIEYLCYRLGTVNYVAGPDVFTITDQPGVSQTISYRPGGQIVRAGVNFRFR